MQMKHTGFAAAVVLCTSAAMAFHAPVAAQTLTLASAAPAPAPVNRAFQAYADSVSQATGGALTINVVAGGTLGRHGQLLDRVTSGVVDIAWDFQGYYPNRFPLSSVAELPFMFDSALEGSLAIQSLHDAGALGGEYAGGVVLGVWAFPNNSVLLTRALPDSGRLDGLRISAQNPMMYAAAEALGAVPVSMGIADWYPAMSRGTIDGGIVAFTAVPAFRFQEVVTHFYSAALGGNIAVLYMNQRAFDALPADHQAALMAAGGESFARYMGNFLDDQAQAGAGLARGANRVVDALDADATARWVQALEPLRAAWLAAGPGDQALIDAMQAAVAAARP